MTAESLSIGKIVMGEEFRLNSNALNLVPRHVKISIRTVSVCLGKIAKKRCNTRKDVYIFCYLHAHLSVRMCASVNV